MPTLTLPHLDHLASQAVFRVLLDTAARPGSLAQLPVRGLGAAAIPLALADVETTVAVRGDDSLAQQIVWATGAALAPLEDAELVAFTDPDGVDTALIRLCRGTALVPELGTKVGLACAQLHAGPGGDVGLRVSGPGVHGTTTLGVDGLARTVFDALNQANDHFPAGIDVWLVSADDRIAALPRSCRLEVS
jgi:alpha-D-ribose 1-methylphosphonate 5-triphosphate synthase subunit PhnH